jgi:hypothetical protein
MGLREVIAKAHGEIRTKELPVTAEEKVFPDYAKPRHDAWLERPESERGWSEQAIQFAYDALRGTFKHERSARISPSSIGDECERVLLFGYAGAPKLAFPKANQEKMDAGTFHHLRWQMEGMSAGYMTAGEVWTHSSALRCGGSADGRLDDGSLFELKTTGGHLYDAVSKGQAYLDAVLAEFDRTGKGSAAVYAANMHAKHKLQMEAYWLVDEIEAEAQGRERYFTDWGSLVYQDPGDPARVYEVRMHASPARRREVHRILEGLHDWIDLNELPDMLEGCAKTVRGESVTDKQLRVYSSCPYREFCPTATRVSLE